MHIARLKSACPLAQSDQSFAGHRNAAWVRRNRLSAGLTLLSNKAGVQADLSLS